MNNSQVAHCWANQTKAKGRGSNFFFEGESIYSYGGHFEVARLVQTEKGKTIALFDPTTYSQSTSQHQSYARQACHNLHQRFDVPSFPYYGELTDDGLYRILADRRGSRTCSHTLTVWLRGATAVRNERGSTPTCTYGMRRKRLPRRGR